MRISDEHIQDALTVDQVIAELQAAKEGGHAAGTDKVVFGSLFMHNCFAIKSVMVAPNLDGTRTVGLSTETEAQWQNDSGWEDVRAYDSAPAKKTGPQP